MEFLQSTAIVVVLLLLGFIGRIISLFWLSPAAARRRLLRSGFSGPRPSFPMGNLPEMYKKVVDRVHCEQGVVSHDIHSVVFPYFATWRKIFGKVFVYWVGTEPFLYIAEPEFLRQVTSGGMGKKWGKPNVFKQDRMPMFGNGLVMVEGDDWTHHRNIIARAFSTTHLNAMIGMMVESTTKMLDNWSKNIHEFNVGGEIDVEKYIIRNAAEIIAKTSFGIIQEKGKKVFEKLQQMQIMLFKSNRLIGVPFSKLLSPRQSYDAWRLGKEIDTLLLSIIKSRKEAESGGGGDLLGFLMDGINEEGGGGGGGGKKLTSRELVDECKTFFFGGHETTALALTWTLLMLAVYPEWQQALREEIMEVSGGGGDQFNITPHILSKLTKMGWVWNEVLRLYSPAPNVQRQAREEVVIGEIVIPKGTNMWVDVVGMHHDKALWGDDVNEFKPERFNGNINGGCKHRMGFIPFGFGGRICIGRNLTILEYKVVLSLILRKFVISVSPAYIHSPRIMLSLRPSQGVPLTLHHI